MMAPCSHALAALVTLASATALFAQEAERAAPEVAFEPYRVQTSSGRELEGRLGRLLVPENRFVEDGREIELAFVVFKTENPEPGAPIMFLAGGPGAPGIELAAELATDARLGLLESHDIIGLDQRGTGLCDPNLSDGPAFPFELPLDRVVTREEYIAAVTESAARTVEYWEGRGVDLSAYTTAESAHDIDEVRRALGIDQLILWGSSYGSHLGLAYLRYHSDHVERSVLSKVEGPDQTQKLPSAVQQRLEGLSELVAKNSALHEKLPDLAGAVKGLLAQLEKEPVTVTLERGGQSITATIGALDLQMMISIALGHTTTLSSLPKAIYYMTQGEWRHVLGFVVGSRHGDLGSAMSLAMDCASGASPARLAQIERERKDPANLLSDAILAPFYPAMCEPCSAGDLGESFRGPLKSSRPVLFVSGELDGRTPVANVIDLLPGFPDHAHLIATNTGHDSRELESEAYCELVRFFLAGGSVESGTIELPPVEFQTF